MDQLMGSRPPVFAPQKTARTLQLSVADVLQSSASALPRSSRSARQIFFQIPAACQSRSRRQQVIPEPHPIFCGRFSRGVPIFNTNKMAVKVAQWGIGGRPPLGLGGCGGNNGSIRSQSASGSNGLATASSLTCRDGNRIGIKLSSSEECVGK